MAKLVYFFGSGQAEGNATMKDSLGGKGAGLAEMTNLGIPVPPGFTISTEACTYYYENEGKYPPGLKEEVDRNLKKIEEIMGARFGDPENPLLLSVRSGARASMPGMMDTILNLGLNNNTVQGMIKRTRNKRFAYDSYRRFIQMFTSVVLGLEGRCFEEILEEKKKEKKISLDTVLAAEDLEKVVQLYKDELKNRLGKPFPEDTTEQLWNAIGAVFKSWNNPRAITYRKIHHIPDHWGTAVNVQAMVFGNMGEDCATGVAFTRNPSTGEKKLYGEFLPNAQGEDVVAGIRTPFPINKAQGTEKVMSLGELLPECYRELVEIYQKLERHYKDMQDIEFTIQQGKLWLLQTRTGKRTAAAAVKISVDMVKEGLINKKTAVLRVEPEQLDKLLHPRLDPSYKKEVIAKGLPASPGAASGQVVFTAEEAEEWAKKGKSVILVRTETSPEDIKGMTVAQGILTATGGLTSHAAVVARGMGKCCVVGCGEIRINLKREVMTYPQGEMEKGGMITLDGGTGEVILGSVPTLPPEFSEDFIELLSWADEVRKLKVRANADTPKDARIAREFGAQGIGLCRTEHMFFQADRVKAVREMILAGNQVERKKALNKILPMQKGDFIAILKEMRDLPVTIRLLDPPLHEFLPHSEKDIHDLAQAMEISPEKVISKVEVLKEFNPMLGHRGCRQGITFPEIYEMQVQAIMEAACELALEGLHIFPEIMIPLVGHVNELSFINERVDKVCREAMEQYKVKVDYSVGTMIELPRACITADEIATVAQFFSFGTNDLTQTVFGFSRDDSAKFLPYYLENGILHEDPFISIDHSGVGLLIELGVKKGRGSRKDLKVGICGEHGGDPRSIEFCHRVGLDYVSCSPYRVPIARLSAAHAVLREEWAMPDYV